MKIPDNMTEEQVLNKIMNVCNKIAPRYVFPGYTIEDMKQESYIICIEAMERYDQKRPLENFLSVNLSNRLKTFLRDHHQTVSCNEKRKKVARPAQLDYEEKIIDEFDHQERSINKLDTENFISLIDKNLSPDKRLDYLKMINELYVSKMKREEIISEIKNILMENGFYEEG